MLGAMITSFFCPLLYFVSLSILLIYLFRRKLRFEQILPIAVMSSALLVYLFTLIFHNISLSFWLSVIIAAVGPGMLLFDRNRKTFVKDCLWTPGFGAFCLLYVVLYALNCGRMFTGWDDYMHWGPFVVDMLHVNDFYTSSSNTALVVHGNYPPIFSIWELIWCKLAGGFQESYLFIALQTLCLSMFWPLFAKLSWAKNRRGNLKIVAVALLCLTLIISLVMMLNLYDGIEQKATFFTLIYADIALGCLFFFGLMTAFTESRRFQISTVIKLSILSSFLLLGKQIGALFVGIIIILYATELLLNRTRNNAAMGRKNDMRNLCRQNWQKIVLFVVALLLPIVCLLGWSIQVDGFLARGSGATQQFHISDMKPWKIPDIVRNKYGTSEQQIAARKFIDHFFHDPIMLNTDQFKITYAQVTILFIAAMIVVAYLYRRRVRMRNIIALCSVVLFGWLAYLFVMLNMYLFGGFTPPEQLVLASIDRYLGSYLMVMILLPIITAVYYGITNTNRIKHYALGIFIFVSLLWGWFFNTSALNSMVPYKLWNVFSIRQEDRAFFNTLEQTASTIKTDPDFSDQSIVVVLNCGISATFEDKYYKYHFRPQKVVVVNVNDLKNIEYNEQLLYGPTKIKRFRAPGTNYLVPYCGEEQLRESKHLKFNLDKPILEKYQVFKFRIDDDGNYSVADPIGD